jgi:alpha-D-ribose 1-methylphosphonate 5-triphosphate synthase subunit PhnI
LPLAGPKDTLRAYRAELDFQLVSVPGDSQPLLLPLRIVATYESDRGRKVVQSDYTPARR